MALMDHVVTLNSAEGKLSWASGHKSHGMSPKSANAELESRIIHQPTAMKENKEASHGVGETDGASNEFGDINPKKVLTKLDLHLIPVVSLLFLLSFLDRGNIGNARIEGLAESLKMTGPQYNWSCIVFFLQFETETRADSSK